MAPAVRTAAMMASEKLFKESHANYSGYCLDFRLSLSASQAHDSRLSIFLVSMITSMTMLVSCFRLGRFFRSFGTAQKPEAIADDQQASAHVCEHRHPHRGSPKDGQDQKHAFNTQSQADVLPEDGMGPLG